MSVSYIKTIAFIIEKFAEYYKRNASKIPLPRSMEKREFGFLLFNKTMIRHKWFKNAESFKLFLRNVVPSHIYYSAAFYERPQEKMESKGWLGANLYFDIDSDHIATPCNKKHDVWTCKKCNLSDQGITPEKCPECGQQRFNNMKWPCEICLKTTKEEALKLIDILTKDFGIQSKEIHVAFSGHRGYHVHVENEDIQLLDQLARKEIVDYVMGTGLDPKFHQTRRSKGYINLGDPGWKGRIAKGILHERAQKERIMDDLKENGLRRIAMRIDKKSILRAIENQSAKIDTVVTTDIHRLIRLSGTLHGKTGLRKTDVAVPNIEAFDPLTRAIAFEGDAPLLVEVSYAPKFRLANQYFGPFTNEKIELPLAAAMFLLCKGAAKVMEEKTHV